MAVLRAIALCLGSLVLSLRASGAESAQPLSREYQIKAVFLFNFPEFVDWPPRAFAGPESPLVIGILGHDPFGAYLRNMVQGEIVNHRPLSILACHTLAEAAGCQVLFISRSEAGRLPEIFRGLKGHSILTVSDADAFDLAGGIIRFATENNKTRLKINLEAAQAADLTLSSKLLRRADVTKGAH
jgi:hypothetical protein